MMPAKLIRPVMLWSRNVGHNEETRKWDSNQINFNVNEKIS